MKYSRFSITLLGTIVCVLVFSAICEAQFTDIKCGITGVSQGAIAWGDMNNDGYLDLALAGSTSTGQVTYVYRNNGNSTFTRLDTNLPGLTRCALAWGDYDNDGYPDLAIAGYNGATTTTLICHNNAGENFEDIGAGLIGVERGSLAWGDYNSDGNLDLAVTGRGPAGNGFARIYKNHGDGTFSNGPSFTGLYDSSIAWGDYNNDGHLDLAMTGDTGTTYITKIYRNESGEAFTGVPTEITGVAQGSLAWGDYDNDGDLDLAVAGITSTGTKTGKVYGNRGNNIFLGDFTLDSVYRCSLAWGDYDLDGDLDLALSGDTGSGAVFKLYRNDVEAANASPSAPTGLSLSYAPNTATFSWSASTDSRTPTSGLNYNLRVGTASGRDDVFSSMAYTTNGRRRIPAIGNVEERLSWMLKLPTGRRYYWSVQSIDASFAGSSWATEQSFYYVKISGYVRTYSQVGISGAVVTASNGGGTYTTSASGYYEFILPGGWTGTLSASSAGNTLDPRSRAYTNVTSDLSNQNFGTRVLTQVTTPMQAVVSGCSAVWGDYDKDGDLDLAFTSVINPGTGTCGTWIYRNDNGIFVDSGAVLTGVICGALALGDYDNDGDLDLVLTGDTYSGNSDVLRIYRNDNGSFVSISTSGMFSVDQSSVAWGDYDNDGDPDLLLAGMFSPTTGGVVTKLYRNDSNGAFFDIDLTNPAGLPSVYDCSLAWGDYDNDGYLDVALSGKKASSTSGISGIYHNDGNGKMVAIATTIPGVFYSSLAWGDYDNDGDLDLAICGTQTDYPNYSPISKIYRNDGGGAFVDSGIVLPAVMQGCMAWGDYDNDGDLDLALGGSSASSGKVFRNDGGGVFVDSGLSISSGTVACLAWGDYDKDGDLDLMVAGSTNRLYRNDGINYNTAPSAPSGLSASTLANDATFTWSAATDGQTPSSGLSYNIRVGSAPGLDDLFSGMANSSSGARLLPAIGNAQKRLSWTLKSLKPQSNYYWAVQSIDSAFTGSAWATGTINRYKISGYVRWASGQAVPATVVLANNGGSSATTDANGYYEVFVMPGWTGSVTPTKAGYAWAPTEHAYTSLSADQFNQNFTGTPPALEELQSFPIENSDSIAWGDYDNDGDLDLLTGGNYGFTLLYCNSNGILSKTSMFSWLLSGDLAWGDYDNDGDLDIAIAGQSDNHSLYTRIYRNDSGSFVDIGASLTAVQYCSLAWADYDNDSDLDLAISGMDASSQRVSKIYRNDGGGAFTDVNAAIANASQGAIAWADYDNDGDLDLALSGLTGGTVSVTKIYRNDGNSVFTDINAPLVGAYNSSLAWGDYDNDGRLDLIVASSVTKLYHNDGAGAFSQISTSIIGVNSGSVVWGDYDNDGDLDIAITGESSESGGSARVYRNDGNGVFIDTVTALTGVKYSSAAWGDYDNDGDLDLAISGIHYEGSTDIRSTKIYRNNSSIANSVPSAPTGLSTAILSGGVTFSWNASSDSNTPTNGLTYNLRIGTGPGLSNIFSGMASSTGLRRIAAIGNTGKRLSWAIKGLTGGPYYWSVQAIDTAYAASAWAAEKSFDYVKISGTIRNASAVPIAGIVVSASSGGGCGTSNTLGYYELIVPSGWTGSLSATGAGYVFSPTSRTCSNVVSDIAGQDFTGSGSLISGSVKDSSNTPLQGVTISSTNNGGSAISAADGSYSLPVPPGWTGIISPNKLNWLFQPAQMSFTAVNTNQTGKNFVATPLFSMVTSISPWAGSVAWGRP